MVSHTIYLSIYLFPKGYYTSPNSSVTFPLVEKSRRGRAQGPMPASTTSSEEKKRFVRRLAKAFGTCTEESRQYGLCLKSYLEGVERGACSAQFEALSRCFKKGLRTAK